MSTPVKHIPPNFVINRVKGWNTRLLYNFYGSLNNTFDYMLEQLATTDNLFDLINTWQIGYSPETVYKGQWSFGQYSNFFKTGKTIRIKGYFLATRNNQGAYLNMKASIENITTPTITDIAGSNGFGPHEFAKDNKNDVVTDVPVNFEITYNSIETSDGSGLQFQSNGFYQYEQTSYKDGGPNSSIVYVPIFNDSSQYVSVGNTLDEYKLVVNFASSTVDSIKLRYLTIEELS